MKSPPVEIKEIAFSEDRNDQIGRYLAQTGVVLISNVRGFGLLTVRQGSLVGTTVPPKDRGLEHVREHDAARATGAYTKLRGGRAALRTNSLKARSGAAAKAFY